MSVVYPEHKAVRATNFFAQLSAAPDHRKQAETIKGYVSLIPGEESRRGWLSLCIDACVRCVDADRLADREEFWITLLRAQAIAGQALATLTPTLEDRHRRHVTAVLRREQQTAQNDAIKRFVLDQASKSTKKTVNEAAEEIDGLFAFGKRTLEEFGSTLGKDRLRGTFGEYINGDMIDKGLKSKGQKVTRTENAVLFAEWKGLYASAASGTT